MTARVLSLAVLAGVALAAPAARAQPAAPNANAVAEAGKHFQRGVTMYNEADYRAALVEFRRAYETAPNAAVLYNIGQTYYQLQNYAAALVALGRYLTEAGPSAAHRREVEATIDTLQTRVGKVAVSTSVPGCNITVDDELVGKTPLDEPVLVSIGRRKISALRDGRVTETRFVDVAAGDTVNVALSANDAARPAPADTRPSTTSTRTILWYSAGGFGAVAIGSGVYAFLQSRSLNDARKAYPANASDLSSKSSRVKLFSGIADISAAIAIVTGAIALKMTLSQNGATETHVALTPSGVHVAGSF